MGFGDVQVIRTIAADLILFACFGSALSIALMYLCFPRKTLDAAHEQRRYWGSSLLRRWADIMPLPDSNSPIGIIIVVMSGLIGLAVAGFIGLVLFLAITHQVC